MSFRRCLLFVMLASSHHPPDISLPFPELWRQAHNEGEAIDVVIHEG